MGRLWLAASCFCLIMVGCGTGPGQCNLASVLNAAPVNSAVIPDHNAASPGNQEKFTASASYVVTGTGTGCAVPALAFLVNATWTSSDTVDVLISSANDDTNGLATCIGATPSPATLTATAVLDGKTQAATTTISCK